MIQHLDNRDLRATGPEIAGHFQSDDAAADDNQMFRNNLKIQDLSVGQHAFAFQAFFHTVNGRDHRFGSGRDNQVPACENLLAALHSDLAVFTTQNDTGTVLDRDLAAFQRLTDTGNQGSDHFVFPGHDRSLIQTGIFGKYAENLASRGMIKNLGAVQECLRGNAPFVQTNTAQFVFFDQQHRQTGASCPVSGQIASGSSAKYNQIKHG